MVCVNQDNSQMIKVTTVDDIDLKLLKINFRFFRIAITVLKFIN